MKVWQNEYQNHKIINNSVFDDKINVNIVIDVNRTEFSCEFCAGLMCTVTSTFLQLGFELSTFFKQYTFAMLSAAFV
jgi:hypothetical protein